MVDEFGLEGWDRFREKTAHALHISQCTKLHPTVPLPPPHYRIPGESSINGTLIGLVWYISEYSPFVKRIRDVRDENTLYWAEQCVQKTLQYVRQVRELSSAERARRFNGYVEFLFQKTMF